MSSQLYKDILENHSTLSFMLYWFQSLGNASLSKLYFIRTIVYSTN